jgi:hypothetical protein
LQPNDVSHNNILSLLSSYNKKYDIDLLEESFSSNSANDDKYKKTWLKSANLFIPQLNKLLKYSPSHRYNIKDIYI